MRPTCRLAFILPLFRRHDHELFWCLYRVAELHSCLWGLLVLSEGAATECRPFKVTDERQQNG